MSSQEQRATSPIYTFHLVGLSPHLLDMRERERKRRKIAKTNGHKWVNGWRDTRFNISIPFCSTSFSPFSRSPLPFCNCFSIWRNIFRHDNSSTIYDKLNVWMWDIALNILVNFQLWGRNSIKYVNFIWLLIILKYVYLLFSGIVFVKSRAGRKGKEKQKHTHSGVGSQRNIWSAKWPEARKQKHIHNVRRIYFSVV